MEHKDGILVKTFLTKKEWVFINSSCKFCTVSLQVLSSGFAVADIFHITRIKSQSVWQTSLYNCQKCQWWAHFATLEILLMGSLWRCFHSVSALCFLWLLLPHSSVEVEKLLGPSCLSKTQKRAHHTGLKFPCTALCPLWVAWLFQTRIFQACFCCAGAVSSHLDFSCFVRHWRRHCTRE